MSTDATPEQKKAMHNAGVYNQDYADTHAVLVKTADDNGYNHSAGKATKLAKDLLSIGAITKKVYKAIRNATHKRNSDIAHNSSGSMKVVSEQEYKELSDNVNDIQNIVKDIKENGIETDF